MPSNSSNSNRLRDSTKLWRSAYLVNNYEEIHLNWFEKYSDYITAGASAPET